MRKLLLSLVLVSVSTAALSQVQPIVPERKWSLVPGAKTAIYGTPETDDVVVRITCPDGIDQLRYEFVYATVATPLDELPQQKQDPQFPDEDQAGPVLIQIDGKKDLAGGSGRLIKYEFAEEHLGWNVLVPDIKWQIEELLKKDGTATISTGPGWESGSKWSQQPVYQYKISLKGARNAIERLRKACR